MEAWITPEIIELDIKKTLSSDDGSNTDSTSFDS